MVGKSCLCRRNEYVAEIVPSGSRRSTNLPPDAHTAPDVTYRGWMRPVLPEEGDSNRRHWRTDPLWEQIQRVQLTCDPPTALKRLPRRVHDLNQVDAELYGLMKLRAVLRGEYLDTTATLSQELRAFAGRMDEVDAERDRDFAEEVRRKLACWGERCRDGHMERCRRENRSSEDHAD